MHIVKISEGDTKPGKTIINIGAHGKCFSGAVTHRYSVLRAGLAKLDRCISEEVAL
jgi:hypothetical protein